MNHLEQIAPSANPKIQNAPVAVNTYPPPLTNSNQIVIQKITSMHKAISFNPFLKNRILIAKETE